MKSKRGGSETNLMRFFFWLHKNDESPDQAGDWLGDNNKNWEFVCEKQDL